VEHAELRDKAHDDCMTAHGFAPGDGRYVSEDYTVSRHTQYLTIPRVLVVGGAIVGAIILALLLPAMIPER
jgi:hypothetical protein